MQRVEGHTALICPSKGASIGAGPLRLIFLNWAHKHPEQMTTGSGALLALNAFMDAFRCEETPEDKALMDAFVRGDLDEQLKKQLKTNQ
jgi:hypothetical protein